MSHKHTREENKTNGSKNHSVVSKCLAIVLISKSKIASKERFNLDSDEADNTVVDVTDGNVIVQSSEVQKALSPNGYNGKELLQDFKLRNKTCYWNPSLVESIKSLEYKGFVEPSTILVTGADIHLENLRSAWGRRVLKAPTGFVIERIGDVNGIQMQIIPQTQFMPLPDALCSIVMDLNTQQIMATWDVIVEKLAIWYKDMTMPDRQLLFDTLSALIKDRKVFHTGSGYFVVTPDTNRLPNGNSSFLPTNASWLPYHPMYVPVFQGQVGSQVPPLPPSRSHMRSISCQVTTIEETDESEDEDVKVNVRSSGLVREPRSHSLTRNKNQKREKESKGEKIEIDQSALKRSSSLKHRSEKEKPKKESSLEPVAGSYEGKKSKGAKPSLFSKIFGRNKKKHSDASASALMPPPPPPPPVRSRVPLSSAKSDASSEGKESKEKEYATFSAQFPPPEWTWYQQQLEKQKRVETWVSQHGSTGKQQQFPMKIIPHSVTQKGSLAHGMNSYTHHNELIRKSHISLHNQHNEYLPMNAMGNLYNKSHWPNGISRPYNGEVLKAQPIKPDNFYESFRNPPVSTHHRKSKAKEQASEELSKHHHPRHTSHRLNAEKRQSLYDFIDQADITPLQISNVYNSVSGLSPVGHISDESTYAKLAERPDHGPLHSTPYFPLNRGRTKTDRMSHGVDGHEARDRIYGPPDDHLKGRSHRSRRRSHKAYSYYGHGDDISYEYKGRLPNKNSSRAQSRDSGVNCVGLAGTNSQGKKRGGHLYENTPMSSKKGHHHHQSGKSSDPSHTTDSHVKFDINDPVPGTNTTIDVNEVTDPAFSSVVYGIHSLVDPHDSEIGNAVSTCVNECSQLPPPYSSLQSAFYEDSIQSLAQPGGNLVTCEVEINPKAPLHTQELACETELIDVENLPDVREVAGSSEEVMVTVADKLSAISVLDCVENCENDLKNEDDSKDVHEILTEAEIMSDHQDASGDNKIMKLKEKNGSSQLLKTEAVVGDSGFSSPRNIDDPIGQTSSQSHSSEHSGGQSQTENSDTHQHSEENAASDSHQTHSDVNMASSEHNSGSTNENGDLSAEDSSDKRISTHFKAKSTGSSHSLKSAGSSSSKHSRKQHFNKPHYSSTAKIITHPDVFNNNTATALCRQDHLPAPMSLHANVINNQRLDSRKYKRDKHRTDTASLPSSVSDQLHQFEEEQLSKKFGANGEYEVMGVL